MGLVKRMRYGCILTLASEEIWTNAQNPMGGLKQYSKANGWRDTFMLIISNNFVFISDSIGMSSL